MTYLDNKYYKNIIEKKICKNECTEYIFNPRQGKGALKNYKVMPGVELSYIEFENGKAMKNMMETDRECIEITYCIKGKIEVKFENEKYAFMSEGDICLFGYKAKAEECNFISKEFNGIKIMIFLDEFIPALNSILETGEFNKETFFRRVFDSDRCIISHGNTSLNHIFKELYVLPDEHKKYLMKIKIIELILYLISGTDYKESETVYFSKETVEKIKQARNIIIENVDKFVTIKQLSEITKINTTDLEKGFKSLYGTTIFAYSRMIKMAKAKELIQEKKYSMLEVSLAVGYSNGGKFARAFRETFGMLPTQYRKEVV